MKCYNCGAELGANSRFCEACGATLTRPSREAIRARVQGGSGSKMPAQIGGTLSAIGDGIPGGLPMLLCGGAALLWILQIVYLAVDTVTASMGDKSLGLEISESRSVLWVLKEGDAGFLGTLLIILCVAGLAATLVPVLLQGRPKAGLVIGITVVTLLIYIIVIASIADSVNSTVYGTKMTLGFAGIMFFVNCVLIPALVIAAKRNTAVPQKSAASPRRTAAPARPAQQVRRPAPARSAVPHPGNLRTGSAARPQNRAVTPPDAETIAALRRMAQMHDQGLVSDEEFERIKAECVARGWIRG